MYIVLARLQDEHGRNGEHVRVAETLSTDWDVVQRRWAVLDEANRKGRLFIVKDDPKWLYVTPANIAYLMVRDTNDPRVAANPSGERWGEVARRTIKVVVSDNAPAKSRGTLERRWGKAHGYHGHVGGWLYRGEHQGRGDWSSPSCRFTGVQGWRSIIPSKAIGIVLVPGDVRYIIPAKVEV